MMFRIPSIMKNHYGIELRSVRPQQGGWAALAFKVNDDRRSYFLKQYEKSRASTPKWTSAIREYIPILAWLSEQEAFRGKVPVPVRTMDGQYRCEDQSGIYLLFEYIEGETVGREGIKA